MLRALQRETGLTLNYKEELFSNEVDIDTILFLLESDDGKQYLLLFAYDKSTEEYIDRLAMDDAAWRGNLFGKKSALFEYNGNLPRGLAESQKNAENAVRIEIMDEMSELPVFSMTRYRELYAGKGKNIILKISRLDRIDYIPVHIEETHAELGTWMTDISRSGILGAIRYLFGDNKDLRYISYKNLPYGILLENGWRHNDFFMRLPSTIDDLLAGMTSKSRYNIKREKRIIEDTFGGLALVDIPADMVSSDIVEKFYEFKSQTHGIERGTYDITSLPITNFYLLKTGDGETRAIALSCEQGREVFLENHTFDSSMREYSFGKILYEMYIEALILKGKTGLALAGGELEYKNRYGTFCAITWSGEIGREKYMPLRLLGVSGRYQKALTVRRFVGRYSLIYTNIRKLIKKLKEKRE